MANEKTIIKDSITLPKKEYWRLNRKAKAYEVLAASFFELPLKGDIREIADNFRKTGLYTEDFLKDLEEGLKKSSLSIK